MSYTGGDALADSLIQHGIEDLFMIPGIQLDWAVEALRKRTDAINLFVPRHEQTTTYMADGYYRASGKVGAAMVVPGSSSEGVRRTLLPITKATAIVSPSARPRPRNTPPMTAERV